LVEFHINKRILVYVVPTFPASAAGKLEQIMRYFNELMEIGPKYGYFPEPSKCILIVRSTNLTTAQSLLEAHSLNFQLSTGDRFLGGFVGEASTRDEWLKKRISEWVSGVEQLAAVAATEPQTAYAGLQKSLQQEWQYLQRVTKDVSEHFAPIEAAISDKFLPALFGEPTLDDNYRRRVSTLPVKHAGLALPDPTKSADSNYSTSTLVCGHLVQALRHDTGVTFSTADHSSTRSEVLAEVKERKTEEYETTLKEILSKMDTDSARTVQRGVHCGQWLSVMPSKVNGTELSTREFRDNLQLRYARSPGDLPDRCDGCGAPFTIQHSLGCKSGGLIIQRHNEIAGELIEWAAKALSPSAVRVEPLILHDSTPTQEDEPPLDTPNANQKTNTQHPIANDSKRGDILIRGLFERGTECIIDVRVTDLDCKSSRNTDPDKVLKRHERQKKAKYLQACLKQRRSFVPFVVSTDGMLGYEANNLIKRIAGMLAEKWDLPYSQTCGLLRARVSIAIARATHLCLRGSRVPASRISHKVQWDDGAGVGLFQTDY
jgi:hypothetical protein